MTPRIVVTPSATHLAAGIDVALCGEALPVVVRSVGLEPGADLDASPFACAECMKRWRATK